MAQKGKQYAEDSGKVNTALCYASVIEEQAIEQISCMCDYELTEGSRIRIMPDVHAGAGCTVGTTMTVTDKVCPNIVGVDIGCGMYTVHLRDRAIDDCLPHARDFSRELGGPNCSKSEV